jgi:hypothetical protein
VAVARQEGSEIGRGRIGVVPADRMQHVDPVGGQLVGRDLQRVCTVRNEPPFDQVANVGQLHSGVADGRAAVAVEHCRALAHGGRHGQRVTLQQALVSVPIGDDVHLWRQFRVALDEPSDGRGKARSETTRGE